MDGMAPGRVLVTCEDEPNLARLPPAASAGALRLGRARSTGGWTRSSRRPGGGARFVARDPSGHRRSYRRA